MVVVDPLTEVIARLEHSQEFGHDVLAQHAVLLTVDEHLLRTSVDPEVVDHAPVVAQLEPGVVGIATQVVEEVGVDGVADHLLPERRHLLLTGAKHRQHAVANAHPVEFMAELGVRQNRQEALGLVVARQEPGLILDVVPERDVRHVMKQGRDPQHALLFVGHAIAHSRVLARVLVGCRQHQLCHVQGADGMLEARVHRTGEHEIGKAKLLDAAQTLELGGVDQPSFLACQLDVAVDRLAKDGHGSSGSGRAR